MIILNLEKVMKNLETKNIYIGELYLSSNDLFKENYLDFINLQKKVGKVRVEVRLIEGWEIPHLHLSNDDFHCAIKLDEADYFIHGIYTDTINNTQARMFDEFMRKDFKRNGKIKPRWVHAKEIFNDTFKNHQIKLKEQPDYTKLNERKK